MIFLMDGCRPTCDYDNGAMDGFLWSEYFVGYQYYGKSIPVPTPHPALVTIRPRSRVSTKESQLRGSIKGTGEVLSPHGFADDEDEDAPDVEERNEAFSDRSTGSVRFFKSREPAILGPVLN